MQKRLVLLGVLFTVGLMPLAAQAQRRSPLADAPAIRKRLELRTGRLEVGGGMMTTLNQDFYHSLMADVKLGFHFTDWLSLSVLAGFTVSDLNTGYRTRVLETLPDNPDPLTVRTPTRDDATESMQKIKQLLAAQLEFTPFTGKYSMFGKLFAHYDFYVFVGGGVLNVAPTTTGIRSCDAAPPAQTDPSYQVVSRQCAVTGYKPGVTGGVGMHTFFGQFVALNLELRDFYAQLNPAGRDVNGDGLANTDDLKFTHTYALAFNVVFYLPPKADISP